MPSVENMLGLLKRLESRDIMVHQHRCVRVRNRNATCARCMEACTSECITYQDNQITVEPANCIGCGTCCTACPTCALEARLPVDSVLLERATHAMENAGGEAVIASERILAEANGLYDPARVTPVANLGRVDESLLIALAKAGAMRITLVQPRDVGPADAKGIETARKVCESAERILRCWGQETKIKISEKFPSVVRSETGLGYDAERRRFFSGLREEAQDVAAVSAGYAVDQMVGAEEVPVLERIRVMPDGTLPHFIPDRRERTLNLLAEMGEPADEMIETRLWGHVIIDPDLCNGCRMCATFCPTGALFKYVEEDGETGVEHAPGDCVKCRCCADICPTGALSISDAVFAADILSGGVERFPMQPERNVRTDSKSILKSIRKLIDAPNIYER